MERNKYELQREVLARKYETILKDFEDTNDDRRIAWNCYQQIIGACEAMRDSGMENNFVCCAVNKSIREQETEIDEIITRFTGKVYRGVRWVKPEEEEHKTVTYREFWAALSELREKFREHHISLDDYTDDETGVISLKVGWASIGSVLAGEAREFADWMRMAASAVENFKYNGCRVKWGE